MAFIRKSYVMVDKMKVNGKEISMVTIKDFQKGDKAYSLLMNMGRNEKPTILEVEIKSVGRTYITIGNNAWTQKYINWNAEYLQEKVNYGEPSLLFKTMEDAENYIEKCELSLWLGCLSVREAEKFSLEQLRKVRELLL